MKPQIVFSRSGSGPHSIAFSTSPQTTTSPPPANVYQLSIPESTEEIPGGFTRIGDYVAELEARQEGAEHIRAARARLAANLQLATPPTLRSIRLALGLSQLQLAARIGTSQSQVARIESGTHDPTYGTFERLARALRVKVTDAVAAFEEARKAAEVPRA